MLLCQAAYRFNLQLMSYRRVIAAILVTLPINAWAADGQTRPEHEDHGNYEPQPQQIMDGFRGLIRTSSDHADEGQDDEDDGPAASSDRR